MDHSGCSVVGKLSQWEPCLPAVLSVVAVDAKVLLACLDTSSDEADCVWVVGDGWEQVNVVFWLPLWEELGGEVWTTVLGDVTW